MGNDNLGTLFIVAAPSGGGKTTLVKQLVDSLDNVIVSISHTTRKKRVGEIHGVDYFFIDEPAFNTMITENAFVEYAFVFNHFYGTSTAQILNRLQQGIDVVLDIDWQGAQQIRRAFNNVVSIFVLPPSLDTLKQRLNNRQDDEQSVSTRMHCAQDEMGHYAEFDYLIVNDDFEKAASQLQAIVIAHRLRMSKQLKHQRKLLSILLASQ